MRRGEAKLASARLVRAATGSAVGALELDMQFAAPATRPSPATHRGQDPLPVPASRLARYSRDWWSAPWLLVQRSSRRSWKTRARRRPAARPARWLCT